MIKKGVESNAGLSIPILHLRKFRAYKKPRFERSHPFYKSFSDRLETVLNLDRPFVKTTRFLINTPVIPANFFHQHLCTTPKQNDKGHRRAFTPMVPFPVVS